MGRTVDLPTFKVDFYGKCREIYRSSHDPMDCMGCKKKKNTAYKEATFRRPLTWWFGKMKRFSQKVSHVETGLLVVWSYLQGSRFDSLEDLFCRKLDERNWSGHILSKNCLAIAQKQCQVLSWCSPASSWAKWGVKSNLIKSKTVKGLVVFIHVKHLPPLNFLVEGCKDIWKTGIRCHLLFFHIKDFNFQFILVQCLEASTG